MVETINSEINIEELKARIRIAAERREAESGAAFVKDPEELVDQLSQGDMAAELMLAHRPSDDKLLQLALELTLKERFVQSPDDHYCFEDLVKYDDHEFIWNAYLAVLKREPDEEGFTSFLEILHAGEMSKLDILARLRYSPEGKRRKVRIKGLLSHAIARRISRLPALGFLRPRASRAPQKREGDS
jgi:hypothetical protein